MADNNNLEENVLTVSDIFNLLSDIRQDLKLLKLKINELNNTFGNTQETLKNLEEKVNDICTTQQKTQKSCENMDQHIDFVEKTYDYFTKSNPLSYMASFKEKIWPHKSIEQKKEN